MDKAQEEARNLAKGSERYFMASVFLSLFVIACIGMAVNRQLELNSWAAEYSNCSLEVKKLTGIAGECSKNQLTSLDKAEFLMQEMQDYKNQAAANADRKDLCDKHLRHVQDKMNQLMHNTTVVVAENEKCQVSLTKCIYDLEDMKTNTAPSPAPTGT